MTVVLPLNLQQVVDAAIRTDWSTVVRGVYDLLGRKLTAYLAGMRDTKAVTRWIDGTTTQARSIETEQRVREAFVIYELLLAAGEAPATIRTWFIGMNPELYDEAPVEAIRAGRLREARGAALAFAGGA